MRTVLTLIAAAALAAPALAQEDAWRGERRMGLAQDIDQKVTATVTGRYTILGGGKAFEDGPSWGDIFEDGVGVGFELALMQGGVDRTGYFLLVAADQFDGQEDDVTLLEPDEMTTVTVLLGFKADGLLEDWFYWDGHVGIGGVGYSAVDASIASGTEFELYSSSAAWVWEIGFHFGVKVGGFKLFVGGRYQYQGPPRTGDDVKTEFGIDNLHADVLNKGVIDAGFILTF